MFSKIITALQGRHTAFALAFFIAGTTLHIFHRLDATYIGFMASLMTFVAGHSIQENYFNKDGQPTAQITEQVPQATEDTLNK
jgi:hypothetical protein